MKYFDIYKSFLQESLTSFNKNYHGLHFTVEKNKILIMTYFIMPWGNVIIKCNF